MFGELIKKSIWLARYGRICLLAATLSFPTVASAHVSVSKIKKRKAAPYQHYLDLSEKKTAELLAVSETAMTVFMTSIRQAPGEPLQEVVRRQREAAIAKAQGSPEKRSTAQPNDCPLEEDFSRSQESRDRLLFCLAVRGQRSLNMALFREVWQMRVSLESQAEFHPENQPTVFLLAWIEDLIREARAQDGLQSAWFGAAEEIFLESEHFSDFDFQDGDVILDLGVSSIVSTISQITSTPYMASHALIVRKIGDALSIVQASVDTGVEELPWKKFIQSNLSSVTVLRLEGFNTVERSAIASRASEIAHQFAKKNVPYDFLMDVDNASEVFCNELIIVAYSQAISEITGQNVGVHEFSPYSSGISNDSRFAFVQRWGVSRKDMPAPGDLFKSSYLKVVADYRNPKNFLSTWNVVIGGQVLMQRVEEGYQVYPPPYLYPVSWAAKGVATVLSPFAENALIPLDYPIAALRAVYTLEKIIKADAIKHVHELAQEQGLRLNVLGVAPWELMAMIQHALDSKLSIRRWFRKN